MSAFAAQKPLSQRRLGGRKTSFSSSLVSSRDEPTVRILYSQLQKNKKLSLSGFIFYFWLGKIKQALTIYKEDIRQRLEDYDPEAK